MGKNQTWIGGAVISVIIGALLALAGSTASTAVGAIPVFGLCVGLAYLINWAVFVPSYGARTEKYFDLTGSLTYQTVTVVALLASANLDLRAGLAAGLVVLWAMRLGGFLFARIRKDGKDGRFDQMKHCLLYTSPSPRDGLLSRMPSSA